MLIASLGDDASGRVACSLLREAGVDLRHVRTVDRPTGTCLITVDTGGENTVVAASSASRLTTVSQLDALQFGAGDILIVQCELLADQTFAAVCLARARGARVILNVAPAMAVPAAVLSALDLLVVNETEAEVIGAALGLSETDPDGIGRTIHETQGCATAVTLGAGGAVLWHKGVRCHAPALDVMVVDTTAAGNSFTGALAAALERGLDMAVALRHGVAAGSLCCTRHGAQTGIPAGAEVLAAISGATA